MQLAASNTRQCTSCLVSFPATLDHFRKDKGKALGLSFWCRACRNAKDAAYRQSNPQKCADMQRDWRIRNAEKVRADKRSYAKENPERVRAGHKAWRDKNREHVRARALEGHRGRLSDPKYVLNSRIRRAVSHSLRGGKKGRSWESLLGYSADDLALHLERQFQPGMTWEKFCRGEIHVDHRLPLSSFDYKSADDPEFKSCWSLTNLQPLWAQENWSKNDSRVHLL